MGFKGSEVQIFSPRPNLYGRNRYTNNFTPLCQTLYSLVELFVRNFIAPKPVGMIEGIKKQIKLMPVPDLMVIAGLSLFIISIPLNHTNTLESSGFFLALSGWLASKILDKNLKIRPNPLIIPLGIVFVTILISLITCLDFSYTLKTIKRDFLQYSIIFLLITDYCRENKKIVIIAYIFLFSNILTLLIFLIRFGYFYFDIKSFSLSMANTEFLFKSLTHTSTYFLFTTTFIYTFLFYVKKIKFFILSACCFLINLFFLFLSNQRAALLGIFFVFISHIFILKNQRIKSIIALLIITLVTTVLIAYTPLKSMLIHENWSKIANLDFSVNNNIKKDSAQVRILGLKYFLNYIYKHPFKGVGYGRKNLKKIDKNSNIKKPLPILHAHNVIVNTILQTGLYGLIALLYLIFKQIILLREGFKKSGCDFEKFIFSGSILFMIGFWIRMQFDDVYRHGTAFTYWIIIGMATSLWLNMEKNDKGNPP